MASQLFIIAVSKSEIVATGCYLELLRVVEIISREQKELIMKHVNALHLQLLKRLERVLATLINCDSVLHSVDTSSFLTGAG